MQPRTTVRHSSLASPWPPSSHPLLCSLEKTRFTLHRFHSPYNAFDEVTRSEVFRKGRTYDLEHVFFDALYQREIQSGGIHYHIWKEGRRYRRKLQIGQLKVFVSAVVGGNLSFVNLCLCCISSTSAFTENHINCRERFRHLSSFVWKASQTELVRKQNLPGLIV